MPKLRTGAPWMERARERIQTTDLVKRLLAYLLADPMDKDETRRPDALMTPDQVRGAFMMLKKVLPDIASQTVHVKVHQDKPVREVTLEGLMREWEERSSQLQADNSPPASTSVN